MYFKVCQISPNVPHRSCINSHLNVLQSTCYQTVDPYPVDKKRCFITLICICLMNKIEHLSSYVWDPCLTLVKNGAASVRRAFAHCRCPSPQRRECHASLRWQWWRLLIAPCYSVVLTCRGWSTLPGRTRVPCGPVRVPVPQHGLCLGEGGTGVDFCWLCGRNSRAVG